MKLVHRSVATAFLLIAAPIAAQDAGQPGIVSEVPEGTVFDEDFLTIGAGIAIGPSYSGSDDYRAFPVPLVQGSIAGIDINPRPAGVAIDVLPDGDGDTSFALGPVIKLNRDRVDDIDDEVVELYGELDTAVEVGPTAGIGFSRVLNPFDSLSFNVDAVWDVAGAHDGFSVSPSATYFTPVSRAAAVSLSLSAKFIDDDYADYYYSVPTIATLLPEDRLPGFDADGGLERIGVNLLAGYDLDGDLTNGGLAIALIGSYSRLTGDAKDTPFTSIRGDADQFFGGVGLAYTFGL